MIKFLCICLTFISIVEINGNNRNDTLKWSITVEKILPKFFFFKQDYEKELIIDKKLQNHSWGISIGSTLNKNYEITIGLQKLNRNYYLQYEPKLNSDIKKITHNSTVSYLPFDINFNVINKQNIKFKLQTGIGLTKINDQIIKEYLDPTIRSNPIYGYTIFWSGLLGLKLEKNLLNDRLFFSFQTNYIHEITKHNPFYNSTNRLAYNFGLKYKFAVCKS